MLRIKTLNINKITKCWAIIPAFLFVVSILVMAQYSAGKEIDDALLRAQQAEIAGQFDNALKIYREINLKSPENLEAFQGLQRNLTRLNRYDQLVLLLEERIKRYPQDIYLYISLGNAYYRTGKQDKAFATWERILGSYPKDPVGYNLVARAYQLIGQSDKAIKIYLKGRQKIGQNTVFARELAELYRSRGEWSSSAKEFLSFLKENPENYSYVERIFRDMSRSEAAAESCITVLKKNVGTGVDDFKIRTLLANQYIAVGKTDIALKEVLSAAENDPGEGLILSGFAAECKERGATETYREALKALVERFPSSSFTPGAILELARDNEEQGLYVQAASYYQKLLDTYPNRPEIQQALYHLGWIRFVYLDDLDGAYDLLNRFVNGYPRSQLVADALFLIADFWVAKGDLQRSKDILQQLLDNQSFQQNDKALFKLAELDYLSGDFDGATARLNEMTRRFPKSQYLNDALELQIFLEECRSSGAALRLYAEADLNYRKRRIAEAEKLLQQIEANFIGSPVVPYAILLLGHVKEKAKDPLGAVQTYRRLLSLYPQNALCPYAQEEIAKVFELQGDTLQAVREYEALITTYPDSLLVAEARRKVRMLQEKAGGKVLY